MPDSPDYLSPRGLLGVFARSASDEDPRALGDSLPSGAWSSYIAAIGEYLGQTKRILVATPTQKDAWRLFSELKSLYYPESISYFPPWETLLFERVSPSALTAGQRLKTLWRLSEEPNFGARVVVAPIAALLQRLNPTWTSLAPIVIRADGSLDASELALKLSFFGYRREYQVEHRGEFSIRGSILDIFPSDSDAAYRIDLFGDEVDSISVFDPDTQRSGDRVTKLEVFPATELLLDEATKLRAAELSSTLGFAKESLERLSLGQLFDGAESWLAYLADSELLLADLLQKDDLVLLVEPSRLRARANDIVEEERSLVASLASTWKVPEDTAIPELHFDFTRLLSKFDGDVSFLGGAIGSSPEVQPWGISGRDQEGLIAKIRSLSAVGIKVIIAADSEGSANSLVASLKREGISANLASDTNQQRNSVIVRANLPIDAGFIAKKGGLALLAEGEISGRRRPNRSEKRGQRSNKVNFDDLFIGGYVVHTTHGVAKYLGMTKRSIGESERDYLLLEYRGGDRLYVPSDQMASITPYLGGESPTLSRLGGSDWQKTRARVKQDVQKVAQELVVLYQKRMVTKGHAYLSDSAWQIEMEDLFPYELTRDQAIAIDQTKSDMEDPRPMDRLICGDVGFGKTEIAIRAAFKAVQDSKQVAVLVPTTLLAEQHFQTFSERFAHHPVRVEMLSRFLSNSEAKGVIAGIKDASVDVVIGTHRLLSGGINFKDLGLLIVDEEQRFGVSHKEAMKKLRAGVDVLTLSATPIPRTLEMSLTGIRDISILNTPPADRMPILTHVDEYDELAVQEAIRRELLREGQVFYVHNKVADIDNVAHRIRELVPEAKVAIAHGQMDENLLEKVVMDFSQGNYDVLVCTTIIESGIDMPTVNTLIADRADLLGLGQLHQLRGRVGRSGQRAYAYLFYPPGVSLGEEAYERLRTIGESTELGSGFRIAMRDLEIRGAGNLLGESQSGHMAAVGYDLYVKMVSEAVAELKGEVPLETPEINLDIPLAANLPSDYVEREDIRLAIYRRLADALETKEVEEVREELKDRFGPLPKEAHSLIELGVIRTRLIEHHVTEMVYCNLGISGSKGFKISPVTLAVSVQLRLKRLLPQAIYKEATKSLLVPVKKGQDLLLAANQLLGVIFNDEIDNQLKDKSVSGDGGSSLISAKSAKKAPLKRRF